MSQTRRKFINTLLGIGGIGGFASIMYPMISYLIPPEKGEAKVNSLKVGKVDDFPPNSSKIIKFGRDPVILVHTSEGEFHALTASCTHLDCIVQYRNDTEQIWCACHNGVYDLNGRNISGPPPKPLDELVVTVVNEEVLIKRAG